jgi:hypothetical protein
MEPAHRFAFARTHNLDAMNLPLEADDPRRFRDTSAGTQL